jgi:hypothetical protein
MARVDSWMSQRDQLAADLRAMADNIASGAVNVAGTVRQAGTTVVAQARAARKRPKMSAEARRRISEAQKARWAKQKGEAGGTAKAVKKGKRGRKAKGGEVGNG